MLDCKYNGSKNDFNKILIGLILVLFPTITYTLTFMFTIHYYLLALLMSVGSVYFSQRPKKFFGILSIGLLVLSLAIYQAYISITATVFIIILIKETLNNKETKEIILTTLKFFCILVISLVLYAISTKVMTQIYGLKLSDYQGFSTMRTYTIIGILSGALRTYEQIISPFFEKTFFIPNTVSRIIYSLCFLLNLVLVGHKI